MSYENPPPPEQVNVSRDSALAEFLRLLAAFALFGALALAALYLAGGWLARFIPFSLEQSWSGDDFAASLPFELERDAAAPAAAIEVYLQDLSDRLAAQMELPAGMHVRVHYAEHPVPNAFATLGGHVVVTAALYRSMPSENALAMVLGHEIGHVRARDPVSAIGGAALMQVALVLIGGDANLLSPALARVVQLGYSRRAESNADALALEAVRRLYGHAGGAAAAFEVLSAFSDQEGTQLPSFLSTHPVDAERIAILTAAAHGWDPAHQPLRPLAVPAAP